MNTQRRSQLEQYMYVDHQLSAATDTCETNEINQERVLIQEKKALSTPETPQI